MGDPTPDQRTPNLRLKFESDDTRNYNWWKLDDFAGGGGGITPPPFDPGVIPPGSIQGSQIAPQAISSDLIFPGETVPGFGFVFPITDQLVAQLNVPLTVATIPVLSGNPRKGPTLITGVLPLTFFNTTAAVASAALNVDLLVYGTATPLVHFQGFNIQPNSIMPFTVPLLMMIQAPQGTSATALVVQLTKTTGADASLQLKTGGSGSVQMSELA
jgi:hypothetical protein